MAHDGGGGEGDALSWVSPPTAYRRFAAPRHHACLVWKCGDNKNALVTIFRWFCIKQRLNTLNFINVIC